MKHKQSALFLSYLISCVLSISEEKGAKGNCPSLINLLRENDADYFPDLTRYPTENYRVKYKTRKNHYIGFVMCKRQRNKVGLADKIAKDYWEDFYGKSGRQGKFVCDNSKSSEESSWQQEWAIPSCADRDQRGAWTAESYEVFGPKVFESPQAEKAGVNITSLFGCSENDMLYVQNYTESRKPDCYSKEAECAFESSEKIDCGYHGIWIPECEERNCCWQEINGEPWCFQKKGACEVESVDKVDCGEYGIDEGTCLSRGCCFRESYEYEGEPHCYFAK